MSDMEKISALSAKIEKMQKQAANSTRMVAIVYLLVVLFVFAYTTFIMNWIKQEVSPNNLSATMKMMIEGKVLTDENRIAIVNYCREQAPVWADGLVQMTHEQLIPQLKDKVREIVDQTSDEGIAVLKKDLFPHFKELILANAQEINAHKDITDPQIANELAKILANECEREMDVFINDKVKHRIGLLRDDLDKMSEKPYRSLCQAEAAKRRLIVNWIFLLEYDEAPSDTFGEFMKSLNGTYEDIMSQISNP